MDVGKFLCKIGLHNGLPYMRHIFNLNYALMFDHILNPTEVVARLVTVHQESFHPGGGGQPRYEIVYAPTNSSIEGVVGDAQNDWSLIMPTWIP